MFENLYYQEAGKQLISDYEKGVLPGAILLSGAEYTGKLTAALELSRVLLCKESKKGAFDCECSSCVRVRKLLSPNILLMGAKNSSLEIAAAQNTFVRAVAEGASYAKQAQNNFVVAVRKLTMRFNEMLWAKDTNASKIANLVSSISDSLDEIDVKTLPEFKKLEKTADAIAKDCAKLESSYMYESLPIAQVRAVEEWASLTSDGYKVVIMESADSMQESVRNALLKTLEEPPANTIFILTTTRKGAILPTILSRVRPYTFAPRSKEKEQEIVQRVFHTFAESLALFFQGFLPVKHDVIQEQAKNFLRAVANGSFTQNSVITKNCGGFEPRVLLKYFFNEIATMLRPLMKTPVGTSMLSESQNAMREAYLNVTVYNQSPEAALDIVCRKLWSLNRLHSGVIATVL